MTSKTGTHPNFAISSSSSSTTRVADQTHRTSSLFPSKLEGDGGELEGGVLEESPWVQGELLRARAKRRARTPDGRGSRRARTGAHKPSTPRAGGRVQSNVRRKRMQLHADGNIIGLGRPHVLFPGRYSSCCIVFLISSSTICLMLVCLLTL